MDAPFHDMLRDPNDIEKRDFPMNGPWNGFNFIPQHLRTVLEMLMCVKTWQFTGIFRYADVDEEGVSTIKTKNGTTFLYLWKVTLPVNFFEGQPTYERLKQGEEFQIFTNADPLVYFAWLPEKIIYETGDLAVTFNPPACFGPGTGQIEGGNNGEPPFEYYQQLRGGLIVIPDMYLSMGLGSSIVAGRRSFEPPEEGDVVPWVDSKITVSVFDLQFEVLAVESTDFVDHGPWSDNITMRAVEYWGMAIGDRVRTNTGKGNPI